METTTIPTPPADLGKLREFMENFYKSNQVGPEIKDRITALRKKLGATSFHAWGGREDDQMELNSLEHIYLAENGQLTL